MTIPYESIPMNGYMAVEPKAVPDGVDAIFQYIDAVLEDCTTANVFNILFDHRQLPFNEPEVDTFDIAARATERTLPDHPIRVAIVTRPERLEQTKIYETIGLNKGATIKVFGNRQMAAYWLTGRSVATGITPV